MRSLKINCYFICHSTMYYCKNDINIVSCALTLVCELEDNVNVC